MEKVEGIENALLLDLEEAREVINLDDRMDVYMLCDKRVEHWHRIKFPFSPLIFSGFWVVGINDTCDFLLMSEEMKHALESEKQG